MLTILPSMVWISVAQPTEQYGQTLGVAVAVLIRNSCARARVGARLAPRPARPAIAVPVAVPAEARRKSRRERPIEGPPATPGRRAIHVPAGSPPASAPTIRCRLG